MNTLKWFLGMGLLLHCGVACDEDGGISGEMDTETAGGDTDTGAAYDPDADVCQFEEPVALGDAEDDGMVPVPPNHPDILYFGRVDCSDAEAPSFAFPGVSIRVRFEGDAIDMVFDDGGSTASPNFYNIVVDDAAPVVLEMLPGENTYILAENLSDGEHTVEVFKRVEANGGSGEGAFLGFRIPEGGAILPLTPRPYRLELIGDSITCGYGNELSVDDPTGYGYTTENANAYNAWGAIAARDLNAEYMAVAYSGRGIFRNYAGGAGATLPEMYLDTLPEDASAPEWEVDRYRPDVVVINLGTNDFSPDIDDLEVAVETFELTYLEFVETLRTYYPEAVFILAVGPMLSDGYPSGYQALTNVTSAIESVIAARSADGDEDVHLLELPEQSAPYGEDWHPTVATHMDMAGLLVDLIDSLNLM